MTPTHKQVVEVTAACAQASVFLGPGLSLDYVRLTLAKEPHQGFQSSPVESTLISVKFGRELHPKEILIKILLFIAALTEDKLLSGPNHGCKAKLEA